MVLENSPSVLLPLFTADNLLTLVVHPEGELRWSHLEGLKSLVSTEVRVVNTRWCYGDGGLFSLFTRATPIVASADTAAARVLYRAKPILTCALSVQMLTPPVAFLQRCKGSVNMQHLENDNVFAE